jgi:ABC-type amino acid transport substrate-binding protein
LVIGVNVPYAPNEFKDAYGEIVGFDVDLMNAVARTLGPVPEYREAAFVGLNLRRLINLGLTYSCTAWARTNKPNTINHLGAQPNHLYNSQHSGP